MRVVAVLCTYNESGAVGGVIGKLKKVLPDVQVVVVDDDSTDGTAAAAESAGARVVVRRRCRRGRGLAGRDGYRTALDLGADLILEMDADGSHNPADAPRILEALESADIAVGSRACGASCGAGGSDDRGIGRRCISAVAKWIVKILLALPLADPTTGYRAFRAEALCRIEPDTLTAIGPEIVEEVYVRACRQGLRMTEVPIRFLNRSAGESKLTMLKLMRVFIQCVRLARR